MTREIWVWLLLANDMRIGAINCKALNPPVQLAPCWTVSCCSESICVNGGLGALGQAVVAPGSDSGVNQPSAVPVPLRRPLLPLLAAEGKMVALVRGHAEPPWVKCPLELPSVTTLQATYLHTHTCTHTHKCDDTKGKITSVGHWDQGCIMQNATCQFPWQVRPCHIIREMSTKKKELPELFNWQTHAQPNPNVLLHGLSALHAVSKEGWPRCLHPRGSDWTEIQGAASPARARGSSAAVAYHALRGRGSGYLLALPWGVDSSAHYSSERRAPDLLRCRFTLFPDGAASLPVPASILHKEERS